MIQRRKVSFSFKIIFYQTKTCENAVKEANRYTKTFLLTAKKVGRSNKFLNYKMKNNKQENN